MDEYNSGLKLKSRMIPHVKNSPLVVEKEWGRELWVHNTEAYCGKILEIDEGKKFSMHFHKIKEETWYILSGELRFEWIDLLDGQWHGDIHWFDTNELEPKIQATLTPGFTVHIPPGLPHRLTALTKGVRIMEVSTQHFDSDSYRIAK